MIIDDMTEQFTEQMNITAEEVGPTGEFGNRRNINYIQYNRPTIQYNQINLTFHTCQYIEC